MRDLPLSLLNMCHSLELSMLKLHQASLFLDVFQPTSPLSAGSGKNYLEQSLVSQLVVL